MIRVNIFAGANVRRNREPALKRKGKKNWFALVVEGKFESRIDERLPISLARSALAISLGANCRY